MQRGARLKMRSRGASSAGCARRIVRPKALAVSKEKNEWEIDSLKCCLCRRCVEVCPVKCLSMDNVYFPSVGTRAEGKYLRVLPAGVVPAYQKAKEAAGKPKESEKPKP